MIKLKTMIVAVLATITTLNAQLPHKVLVGYWHNWESLRVTDVDDRYTVICLSFLEADKNGAKDDNVVGDLEFTPWSAWQLKNDIATVQAEGKKVLISIGGANGSFKLNNTTDKNTFVQKVKDFITEYGVDGIDIDIERTVYICPSSSQNMSAAETHIQYLIDGCKELLTWYQNTYNKKMIFTTAPEVAYTVGGTSPWNDCNGALLPFLEQLKDDIDLLMIQLYNSGSVYPQPGYSWPSNTTAYSQGNADFIVVCTEAAIEGFTMPSQPKTSGTFSGFPASKVVVALPACSGSGSGHVSPSVMASAVNYLMGTGPKPGSYTLSKSYPDLRGLMTWSINNDKDCSPSYKFAQGYEDIFGSDVSVNKVNQNTLNFYPNPTNNEITITGKEVVNSTLQITDLNGKVIKSVLITNENQTINISDISKGVYFLKANSFTGKVIVK